MKFFGENFLTFFKKFFKYLIINILQKKIKILLYKTFLLHFWSIWSKRGCSRQIGDCCRIMESTEILGDSIEILFDSNKKHLNFRRFNGL